VRRRPFGETADGEVVELFTLRNRNGVQLQITNYGAAVVSLLLPGRHDELVDVVLGFDALDDYLLRSPYFGATIGRYANRIGNARFVVDGIEYNLAANDGKNHLHGGFNGFDKVVWDASASDLHPLSLELRYLSADREQGYPADLSALVRYTLSEDNQLTIEYLAASDADTVVNLTNHSYFNLAGAGSGDILAHELMIDADRFTPVNDGLIPTGELRDVAGTPFDFRTPTAIGLRIERDEPQLRFCKGYDHNFVLNGRAGDLRRVARVLEPGSRRRMEVWTTEPGLQLYTGNFLDGTLTGKGGFIYGHRSGFCLETQHFPDSPNKPNFPSTLLKAGTRFESKTVYKFSTEN